jgi:hypothetical protein
MPDTGSPGQLGAFVLREWPRPNVDPELLLCVRSAQHALERLMAVISSAPSVPRSPFDVERRFAVIDGSRGGGTSG